MHKLNYHRPHVFVISIFQHGSKVFRQTSIFDAVLFVSKSLLGAERLKKLPVKKNCNFDLKASEPAYNIDISNVSFL